MAELLGWACRTPARLAAVTALAVAVVLGAATAFTTTGSPTSSQPASHAATPTADVPAAERFAAAAVRFVDQWARLGPGETPAQWRGHVRELATPDLAAGLALTDPDALPGTGVGGEPELRFLAESSALVAVPLASGERVLVTVIDDTGRLLVADIQPDVGDYGAAP